MSRIRQVLLLGHTHHDVGYTNSPRIVDRAHKDMVRRVLDLCDRDATPGPDQLRWTFEVARPVLRFLQEAPEPDVARLRARVAEGRISVTGGYLNMTQLPSTAELEAGYEAVDAFRAAGLRVRTEQHGDVNGIAWGTVEAMRRAGLDRLVMALNPDHGRPPLVQPSGFWWEGVSGHRVFVWLSTHYGVGEEWGIVDGDTDAAERHISQFVAALEARPSYPFDVAVVHAGNDNRWPTARFLDVVRDWNRRHPELPMRTATIDDALDRLLAGAAGDLPVVRGEWSDWWSHGHGSTAREVAVYREARSFARAAGTTLGLTRLRGDGSPALAEVVGYRRGPCRLRADDEVLHDLAAVEEQLLLFTEHTWGSWESYSKPFSTFSHSAWNAKAGFAYTAFDEARDLAVEGFFRLLASGPGDARAAERALAVVNPTASPRREPVEVEVDGRTRTRAVVAVPAFGTTLVPLPPQPVPGGHADAITYGSFTVRFDAAAGGVVSIVDRWDGRELVDPAALHGLGAVVVEEVVPGSVHPMTDNPKAFRPEDPGPPFRQSAAPATGVPEVLEAPGLRQLRWRSEPAGLPPATTTLTLYEDVDAIDLEVDLAKPERFGPESIFVAFPFLAQHPEVLLETAGAVFAADTEQLPDTSKDWYSIQHAVGVNGEHGGFLWATLDAPLVQLGGFRTGLWATTLDATAGHLNSWLMNNLHFTNFQARQEGTRRYRYRLVPTATRVTREQVARFGHEALEPLQARAYDGPVVLDGPSGLQVEPADRLLAEVRPVAGDAVRVRLRALGPDPVEATVRWTGAGVAGGGTVRVDGHGVADVVLRRRP
ncbi:MAG: hypothetical protein BGO38_12625 [Cellulomonas sp. 73-145]|uniref:glycoside hydrolase family 38 N-terminal domain-containing protein n=1 Tax=Cellulomonas sp. 73-145 TaxID=1895739 RepID=UPI000926268C|nr:hypothetical protein [Cellulomonas sp. 73-145]MBN9328511.1 hypothetical protein [Cellulomonas sp.]OJV59640.1 MAG: hypothetical protein BGO38_12625 [Cellulomonas sp. 73-145]